MNAHREEHLGWCAEYVLGLLEDEPKRELEAHLAAGCAPCEAELRALAGGTVVLALAAPAQPPDPALRERVLAAVRAGEREGAARPSAGRVWPRGRTLAWAAAAAVVVFAGWFGWQTQVRLASELQVSRDHARRLDDSLQGERRWSELLHGAATRVVRLTATADGDPAWSARVFLDRGERRAVVIADQLPSLPGRDHELWAITPEGPRSLGVLARGGAGRNAARLESLAGLETLTAFAISEEASGGSPDPHQPHGRVVLLGRLEP